jgi:hypothetical protein
MGVPAEHLADLHEIAGGLIPQRGDRGEKTDPSFFGFMRRPSHPSSLMGSSLLFFQFVSNPAQVFVSTGGCCGG